MKYFFKHYLIAVSLMLFIGCADPSGKQKEELRFRTSEGLNAVIPYRINDKDTVYDGEAKYYYDNGILSDKTVFVDGMREGFHFHYDSTGRLISKIFYRQGVKDGPGIFFDAMGRESEKNTYVNGRLFFSTLYFSNGKPKQYAATNDTLPFYLVKYDSMGVKKLETGYSFALSEDCFSSNLDSVKVGNPIKAIIPVALIPGYSIKMQAAKFDKGGSMIGGVSVMKLFPDFALYEDTIFSVGNYTIGIASELMNEEKAILRRDTLQVHIKVIE